MLIEATWEKGAGGVRLSQECQESTPLFGKLANTDYIMALARNWLR